MVHRGQLLFLNQKIPCLKTLIQTWAIGECLPLLHKTFENLGDVLKIIETASTEK